MYDAALGRFYSIDPKAETYSFQTLFAYAANNLILYIDKNGENPVLPALAIVVAVDAALFSTGIVATGLIVSKSNNGSLYYSLPSSMEMFIKLTIPIIDLFAKNKVRSATKSRSYSQSVKTNQTNKKTNKKTLNIISIQKVLLH